MKRILALGLCLALLCPAARAAEEAKGWSRSEPGGDYVTLRVPCPQGEALDWSEQTLLAVRYADTGEPVPLTSDYQQGWLFATVPAEEAERPLEVFQGEEHRFPDCITVWKGHEYYNDPGGAKELYLRGVLQGDHAGNLNPDAALTRAEAFALICRLLSLEPGGDPGYADAEPGDWYYDTASAARAGGLAAEDAYFHPRPAGDPGRAHRHGCPGHGGGGLADHTGGGNGGGADSGRCRGDSGLGFSVLSGL